MSTATRTPAASRRKVLGWAVPAAIVAVVAVVLLARWLRTLAGVEDFIAAYPGSVPPPPGTPEGFPAWLSWQHFLNAFFVLLIVRTGWRVRTVTRPEAHWTRDNTGRFRTTRAPKRISFDLWLHLTLDALWVLNGIVFVVLLFATGHWARIVPTSWEVVPNALSVLLQYLSLDWPTEDGWVVYNSLQLLAYFAIVFVAAPLALVTGLRMSPAWPVDAPRLNRAYPIELARAIHFPTMLFFVAFVVAHVGLVLATGALRNLNHMYAGSDEVNWIGAAVFAGSVVVMVAGWVLARPMYLRGLAQLTGKVTR
ncbi:cytochrome b/b6 domain-containing protein [Agromyces sp. SYSU T00194]|uniref:cytochrome b/b6 domain-containing protein n=1 Tax=Agromyces chitinivorans TaxID=3158560 RepID=UPI003399E9F9